jgi:hypothetical protein
MAEPGTNDDLDTALAKALADALALAKSAPGDQTKGARVRKQREAIDALRATGKTWEQIADVLSAGGLKVSARTVRLEMTKDRKTAKKGAKVAGNGKPARRTEAAHTTPQVKKLAANVASTEGEHVVKPATEAGFYDAGGVEN